MSGSGRVEGPEFRRGDWVYYADVHIPEIYDEYGEFDSLLIQRQPANLLGDFVTRFKFYFPHRYPGDWGDVTTHHNSPWDTGKINRYADLFAAAEPLVDFDAAWAGRTDYSEERGDLLRQYLDRDWAHKADPVDLEYTAAYRKAKRAFTQLARTPEQLIQWRAEHRLDIEFSGPGGAVLLAFPDGAPQTGPDPSGHPHWSGVEPDMGEGLPRGWQR